MYVRSTRDALLDLADPDLSLSPVVVQFRKFLKIVVTLHGVITSNATHSESAGPNTFDVMRRAMHEQTRTRTPSLTLEHNRKDRLYNAVIENFNCRGLQWR